MNYGFSIITQLKTEDYENTYFELANDIIINVGQFKYDNNSNNINCNGYCTIYSR